MSKETQRELALGLWGVEEDGQGVVWVRVLRGLGGSHRVRALFEGRHTIMNTTLIRKVFT